jgi:2-polyprenyl-3-methyl-5-hydroxy-6-metoxy-1,4-benzoquinol methylase
VGDQTAHWENVYRSRAPTEVSWYEPVPHHSLELIRATGLRPTAPILDIGGGASTLVDHLLADGYSDLTVLDLARTPLDLAQARLGDAARAVKWIVSDVNSFRPERRYALWHDRAVLHFLTSEHDQAKYVEVLKMTLEPEGHVVLAIFGPEGPTRCSGLPVQRYAVDQLSTLLGTNFWLRRSTLELHLTPSGQQQQFLWTWWQAASRPLNYGRRF